MRIPFLAPSESEETIAIGVASPSAQGHEIISTQTALSTPCSAFPVSANHAQNVTTAIAITLGTKIFATRSAKRLIGIFLLDASLKSSKICDKSVWLASFVTFTLM